jgi:hypothetical protein
MAWRDQSFYDKALDVIASAIAVSFVLLLVGVYVWAVIETDGLLSATCALILFIGLFVWAWARILR